MNMNIPGPADFPGHTAAYVAQNLRAAILQGRLKSGQPLRQDQLAGELGVSKIPVREALVQLKAEGLVTFLPNRGAVVTELNPAEVDEIYTMRLALETAALQRAIPRLRPADLIRAEGVLEIIDQEEDRAKWGELNWEFHATLYQAAGLLRLLGAIRNLHDNVGRYLVVYLSRREHWDISQREHRAILAACREGDIEAASTHLKGHLEQASRSLMGFLGRGEAEGIEGGSS